MGKLIVTNANGETSDFELSKERVTVGRHNDNDICLNDKAVSGHHAVIITILQDSFLEDLDSTNGTQVNGKQIAKHPLSNGDVIAIGRNTLKYEGEGGGDEDEFEKTMILRPSQLGAALDESVKKADSAPAAPRAADRSVSRARRGPSKRPHHAATSALPVSAWKTTTTLSFAALSVPQVW